MIRCNESLAELAIKIEIIQLVFKCGHKHEKKESVIY